MKIKAILKILNYYNSYQVHVAYNSFKIKDVGLPTVCIQLPAIRLIRIQSYQIKVC